jgi:GTP cyclohydrolase I
MAHTNTSQLLQRVLPGIFDADGGDMPETPLPTEQQSLVLIADSVLVILEQIGERPERPGLIETPMRAAKAWMELTAGYIADVPELFKTFEPVERNQMVTVRNIRFHSLCEHHLLPFYGVADIGYIPNGKILGLSKFARLVDAYARRLQVQEHLTQQILKAIEVGLQPHGVIVKTRAVHMCMEMRGINAQGAATTVAQYSGAFEQNPTLVSEFYSAIGS